MTVEDTGFECRACGASVSSGWKDEQSCDQCGTDFTTERPRPCASETVPDSIDPAQPPECVFEGCDGVVVDGRCATCMRETPVWPSLVLPWMPDEPVPMADGSEIVLSRTSGPFEGRLRNWPNVSAPHCRIIVRGAATFVADGSVGDKPSLNGTYLNGCRLEQGVEHEVLANDEIRLGRDNPARGLDSVRLRVVGVRS